MLAFDKFNCSVDEFSPSGWEHCSVGIQALFKLIGEMDRILKLTTITGLVLGKTLRLPLWATTPQREEFKCGAKQILGGYGVRMQLVSKRGNIQHIEINVSDLNKSKDFYEDLLGWMGYERVLDEKELVGWGNGGAIG